MLARLGQVLYWVACGLAVIMLIIGTIIVLIDIVIDKGSMALVLAIPYVVIAGIIWFIGRAIRYVLVRKMKSGH